MPTDPQQPDPILLSFLLLPNYSMIAVSAAIEPLRMANRLAGMDLYHWSLVTLDGQPVPASNGTIMMPDQAVAQVETPHILFVCSGIDVSDAFSKPLQSVLCSLSRRQIRLGSLCTGSYLLARCGLLNGYRCTIHWENMAGMREKFPRIRLSDELYEIDRDRYTCAGGIASLDMMLQLISETNGSKLSANISEQLMCDRIRGPHEHQRVPLQQYLGTSQPKLTEAVTLMENNIEEPISLDELSRYVGVSRRQLERLFQKYLHCVPTRYYMNVRLDRARQLLLQTDKSIIDVAQLCGFVSAPHFSKCYRVCFGIPPRDERHRIGH